MARKRDDWSAWFCAVRRWLRHIGIVEIDAALGADLMALFEQSYEPQEAAYVLAEEDR